MFLAVSDVVGKLMMFAFHMIAARHLGVAGFGVLNTALAFVSMWVVLTDLGLGGLTAREIARDRRVLSRYVPNVLSIKLVASIVTIGIVMLVVRLMQYPAATARVTYICSFTVLTTAVAVFYSHVFQGLEKTHWTFVGRTLQALILLAGAVLLSFGQPYVERYAFMFLLSGAIAVVALALAALRVGIMPGLGFSMVHWGRMLRVALPFGISALFSMFYYWNGFPLLSRLVGDQAAGIYGAAFRIALAVVVVGNAFAGALYPQMSRVSPFDRERLRVLFERAYKYLVLAGMGVATLVTLLSRHIILAAFGPDFSGSVPVLVVLVWWAAIVWLNALLSNYLFAANREKVVSVQTGVSLGLNVTLNLLLLPVLGPLGAAAALVAAEVVGFSILAVWQRITVPSLSFALAFRAHGTAIGCAVPAGVAAWLAIRWNPVVALVAFLVAYLAMAFVLRGIDRGDIRLLTSLVKRVRVK
ncbi:MAG: flippase [candidate division WOR-3 bacterium]|nr:MAG: flippase [candidate division WOR-3 bacterium]